MKFEVYVAKLVRRAAERPISAMRISGSRTANVTKAVPLLSGSGDHAILQMQMPLKDFMGERDDEPL